MFIFLKKAKLISFLNNYFLLLQNIYCYILNKNVNIMSTDKAWEKWGQKDPYFGVITDEKFRSKNINDDLKKEFFISGENDIKQVTEIIKKFVDSSFNPSLALDFGCGTGRTTMAISKIAQKVIGIDISESMLQEATKNCEENQINNVQFYKSDDQLSALQNYKFDFIHTIIVLQHIPIERVRIIFEQFLNLLKESGVAAIQLTYGKMKFKNNYGAETLFRKLRRKFRVFRKLIKSFLPSKRDPEMQMNCHQLNQIFFLMQNAGVKNFYTEFTNHGGELGVFLYFKK